MLHMLYMKKRLSCFMVAFLLLFTFCACSGKKEEQKPAEEIVEEETLYYPDILQIRYICELATLECYYHNVAKSEKPKGSGIVHWGEKDRVFWIEYSGVAKFGIDISKVKMEIDGQKIIITIPKAGLLGLSDYTFTEDSYISSDDGMNKNPITADNQTEAIAKAEEDIKLMFENDEVLLMRAQDNAKKLIESYIKQLGEISGTDYQIVWNYEE